MACRRLGEASFRSERRFCTAVEQKRNAGRELVTSAGVKFSLSGSQDEPPTLATRPHPPLGTLRSRGHSKNVFRTAWAFCFRPPQSAARCVQSWSQQHVVNLGLPKQSWLMHCHIHHSFAT
jgi:hypothetical protein